METAIRLTLWIRVLAGTVALLVAPIALVTVKGGPSHRRWGRVYFWAMAVVAATAIVVGFWRSILFLVLTAVFSFYAALSGYRAVNKETAGRCRSKSDLGTDSPGSTLGASWPLRTVAVWPSWDKLGDSPGQSPGSIQGGMGGHSCTESNQKFTVTVVDRVRSLCGVGGDS